ncbi:accessory factor UbiK family protein [Polycladidibacter stylochi]|uniref:accessory factor UbiK family protein n=1 Tax=Polycladidibacter stylochi TaxID=1807766 RepID=UPI000830B5EB|nr:accessory factor UbiK family protein [Pseudovibrio stylochi]
MNQSPNRLFDEFAKLMNDAAGMAQGAKREVETAFQAQLERFISDMDLIHRDEFDAMKELAVKAMDRADELEQRVAALEKSLSNSEPKED